MGTDWLIAPDALLIFASFLFHIRCFFPLALAFFLILHSTLIAVVIC